MQSNFKDKINGKVKINFRIEIKFNNNGDGQECPSHIVRLLFGDYVFFEDYFGLFGIRVLEAVGAGYVAEGHGNGHGAELPERALALGVGIRRIGQDVLRHGQIVLRGVRGVIGELEWLRVSAEYSGLSEGAGGEKETETEDDQGQFEFHGVFSSQ
jgi:hypothetical protein